MLLGKFFMDHYLQHIWYEDRCKTLWKPQQLQNNVDPLNASTTVLPVSEYVNAKICLMCWGNTTDAQDTT